MNAQNKKKNISEELQRANEALKAASVLNDAGLLNDAVSRLYYCVLHNIRALLLTKGLQAKSHEGALRLFGLHFVKEGIFDTKSSHVFSKLMKYREEADYNPSYMFTSEDFSEFNREAIALAGKIQTYLKEENYI